MLKDKLARIKNKKSLQKKNPVIMLTELFSTTQKTIQKNEKLPTKRDSEVQVG